MLMGYRMKMNGIHENRFSVRILEVMAEGICDETSTHHLYPENGSPAAPGLSRNRLSDQRL